MTVADDVELVRPEKLLDFIEGDLTAMALENRADVRAMRAQVEEAGLRLRREESSWWPEVNVFGSYGFISLDDLELGTDKDEFQIGAALSMNLFEGGATSARINARKHQLDSYARFIDVTLDPSCSRSTTFVDGRHTFMCIRSGVKLHGIFSH